MKVIFSARPGRWTLRPLWTHAHVAEIVPQFALKPSSRQTLKASLLWMSQRGNALFVAGVPMPVK